MLKIHTAIGSNQQVRRSSRAVWQGQELNARCQLLTGLVHAEVHLRQGCLEAVVVGHQFGGARREVGPREAGSTIRVLDALDPSVADVADPAPGVLLIGGRQVVRVRARDDAQHRSIQSQCQRAFDQPAATWHSTRVKR